MAVIALTNAKGSTGVTIAALAFTLTWPRPVLLAECDPAGGDIAAGFLRHLELDGSRGLMQLFLANLRGLAMEQFWAQLIDLTPPDRQRLLLPGITSHAQAASLDPSWHELSSFFAALETDVDPGFDVIADCGRLIVPHAPWPLLSRADISLLVVRPVLSSLQPAHAVLAQMRDHTGPGADDRIGLLVIGDGDYDDRTVARRVGAPVVAHLPSDDRSARVLARGGTVRTRRPLLRAAAHAADAVTLAITKRRERMHGPARPEGARVSL